MIELAILLSLASAGCAVTPSQIYQRLQDVPPPAITLFDARFITELPPADQFETFHLLAALAGLVNRELG